MLSIPHFLFVFVNFDIDNFDNFDNFVNNVGSSKFKKIYSSPLITSMCLLKLATGDVIEGIGFRFPLR